MRKPGRNHSAAFKAHVALEAIRGEKTVAEIMLKSGWETPTYQARRNVFKRR